MNPVKLMCFYKTYQLYKMTTIQSNVTYCSTFTEVKTILKEKNDYKYVYISIGSKWNEQTYEYKNRYGHSKLRLTNSLLQMIPNFMKDREKSLIICIDDFRDIENRMKNFSLIKREVDENMDFIFYDSTEFQSLLQFILETMTISPENLMIVNYVRFLHNPNVLEYKMECEIPEIIQNLLDPTIFKECFYQWFGYQVNLYNIIYNYSRYKLMFRLTEIICTIDTLLDSNLLGIENIDYVYEHYKTQKHYGYFETFLKNVVDISSFTRDDSNGNICSSLML